MNKVYRTILGGDWVKTKASGWIRPELPLMTRKMLSDIDQSYVGETYPHSLISQNYTPCTGVSQ